MRRRSFLRGSAAGAGLAALGPLVHAKKRPDGEPRHPNVLLITVDDMNWDTPASFGGPVPGVTPRIDAFAAVGHAFERAHVTVGVCMPSRLALMSGIYPHRSGADGFLPLRDDVTTLQERLSDAGYRIGILGKKNQMQPAAKFRWDVAHGGVGPDPLGFGRDPKRYGKESRAFFDESLRVGKPFFLMANSHDPHRPFSGSEHEQRYFKEHADSVTPPSRVFSPDEVPAVDWLPDLPEVKRELAQYLSSARRADDTVGEILDALEASGAADETVVMLLSDNGMSAPFAKSTCYLNGTRTPWVVRWPGVTKSGTRDAKHYVTGIDFAPTVLEICGLELHDGMDGRSFVPLLRGEEREGPERAFTVYGGNASGRRYPTRCVHDGRFGYVYNAWSDGKLAMRTEAMVGLTWSALEDAAKEDPEIAARVQTYLFRTPEELYDLDADPSCLSNLARDPAHRERLMSLRSELGEWMTRTEDPLGEPYNRRLRAALRAADADRTERDPDDDEP